MPGTPAPGSTAPRPDDAAVYRFLAFGADAVADRSFLTGAATAPATALPQADRAEDLDLDLVRRAVQAAGEPVRTPAALVRRVPPRAAAPTTLAERRHDVRARLAAARERAAVPADALLNAGFVEAHEDERPAQAGRTGRLAGLAAAVVPPAPSADDELARTAMTALGASAREVFASRSFAARPYVDAPTVRALFDDFLAHPGRHDAARFWRLLVLELWLRELGGETPAAAPVAAVDVSPAPAAAKPDHEPNPGKALDLVSEEDGRTYRRFPLQTALVDRSTDLMGYLRPEIEDFFRDLPAGVMPHDAPWHFSVSEKIIAITQGRSYFTWEIRPTVAARVLSRFVTRTPAGIGLGDPTTMQLAIQEAGLPRIVAAAAAGVAGKAAGRRGVFYNVVGGNVRAIDGPTTYSTFPANVSAKLPPADPDGVARAISAMVRTADIPDWAKRSYAGAIVMDANDIGRNALGSDSASSAAALEATFADNPLGQGRERTPLAVVVRMD